jgi:hypothetical protein
MRGAILFCLLLLLGLSIAGIAAAFFFVNAVLPVVINTAVQTALFEGVVALVLLLFMAVIFVCATNLVSGPARRLLGSGSFILFEILKAAMDRSP